MPDRLVVDLTGDGQVVVSSWPDGGVPTEVSRARLLWPLDGDALEDLRWYLEDYLLAPFGVWEERGPAVQGKLVGWGEQVFGSVFRAGPARDACQRARDRGVGVVLRSKVPGLLGLPWELMRDQAGPVALEAGGISRTLPVTGGAETVEVLGGRLRLLMVIARPGGTSDVGYQMVARPLLERLEAVRGEVELTVLRPPTFAALRETVQQAAEAGRPFHVVHFDGHGAMSAWAGEGVLAFELPGGGSGYAAASQVAAALAAGRVPVVVLNACQSGAMGKELEASVATALLRAGCAAVVAMAYKVYAAAAAEFMAMFYESLFAGNSVGMAVGAGRRRLFERDGRPSPKGDIPLADWLVPVCYMRREVLLPRARIRRPATATASPGHAVEVQDPLAEAAGVFVGRDDLFYQLEAAARRQHVVVLAGLGGTGKTEVAKGFARWQRDTGGVDDPRLVFWHSFESGVASFGLDGVITAVGLEALGADFARLDSPRRLETVKNLLARDRALLIWDNFESVREMPDPAGATPPLDEEGCARLREFLDWVRSRSRSTVVITSRAREDWLGRAHRIEVGGLNRAEAARYGQYLLAPFPAARARREQRSFGELLDWLDGHPLAMRLTMPRLDDTDPVILLAGLQGAVPLPDDGGGEGRLSSLGACITYSFAHLGRQTARLLPAASLLHGIADAHLLTLLSSVEGAPGRFAGTSREEWTAVLEDAARVGLLTRIGSGMYRIHPALPGYLSAAWRADVPGGYDQERDACEQALCTASAAFSHWLTGQIRSGNAALAYTMIGAQRRTLGAMLGRALDHHAWQDAGNIVQALDEYWDTRGLDEEASAWADRVLAATAGSGRHPAEKAGSLWLHTTIHQASRQKDAGQPGRAGHGYQQALAYLQDQPATESTRGSISVLYNQLGMTAQVMGRLDEADDWYRKSLAIKEELGNRPGMSVTYHQLGITAQIQGRLDEAVGWYRKSLALEEALGNRPAISAAYHQLGMIAQDLGRLDEAVEWHRRSVQIREELGLRAALATNFHQLGTIAQGRGRVGEAEDWYRKSLAVKEELGDRSDIGFTYHQLAILAQDRGQPDEADDWYRKSLAVSEELGDRPGIARAYAQLGLLAEYRGQAQQALEWNIRCVTLSSPFPSPLTGTGPAALARLTRQVGMPALEQAWQLVTGEPVPQAISDYITHHPPTTHPGKGL